MSDNDLNSKPFPEDESFATKHEILSFVWLLTLGYPLRGLGAFVGMFIGCLTGDKYREEACSKEALRCWGIFAAFWVIVIAGGMKAWELCQKYILN